MSVNVNQRTGNSLEVLNMSLNLLNYTYDRTQKAKVEKKTGEEETGCFPKSAKRLANNIWDNAEQADAFISYANDIIVHTEADYQLRRTYQMEARGRLKHLPRLLLLAHRQGYVTTKRLEFWVGLVYETLSKFEGWTRSDERRYNKG